MKIGTVKTIKETNLIIKLGEDFQANDLEDFLHRKQVKKEKLEEIIRKNFNSLYCPRLSWSGWFDKETQEFRFRVEEDLFI